MRKDVLDIILKQMSQDELIAAFMRMADLSQTSDDDLEMEWILGLYPNINAAWLAEHDEGIKRWVTENVPNVKEMKVEPIRNPWYDVTVKILSSEERYINNEDLERFDKAYSEAFEGITLDNAQEKIDAFYSLLKERGIFYGYYSGNGKKKVLMYAVRTVPVDRDYINSLDKKTPL